MEWFKDLADTVKVVIGGGAVGLAWVVYYIYSRKRDADAKDKAAQVEERKFANAQLRLLLDDTIARLRESEDHLQGAREELVKLKGDMAIILAENIRLKGVEAAWNQQQAKP